VTIVWGREAEITPLSRGRTLAESADARLVVFDDAKLLPHVEFPAAFLDATRVALADEDRDEGAPGTGAGAGGGGGADADDAAVDTGVTTEY
jgi:hypothetical protein